MGFKYYSGMIMQLAPSFIDRGDLQDWNYTNIDNGKVRLDKYIGASPEVYVPRVNGQSVIQASAFYNMKSITSVDCQNVPPFTFGSSFTFYNCTELRSVMNLSDSITNMHKSFQSCDNFNYPVKIPQNTVIMNGTFFNCSSFNSPISIPNKVEDMYQTFSHCPIFNQPVEISNSVTNMHSCFWNSPSFNQPMNIPDSVINMRLTFENCWSLNAPITIGNGPNLTMYRAFYGCNSLNSAITIGTGVVNLQSTFDSCTDFSNTITIYSTEVTNSQYMFNNTSKSKQVYIYFQYANGVNTKTYNRLSPWNGKNGVTLHDLGTAPW